jgi:phosphotransferase system HPr (HPr) family protein
MFELKAIIQNSRGIHVRPACAIYKAFEEFTGHVTLTYSKQEVPLTSIMDIICLGLGRGDTIGIRVEGSNERRECEKLVELFQTSFDFPARESEARAACGD